MSAVELVVNECKVFATVQGADWWIAFRHHQPITRFRVITASIAGDRVAVACEDRAHADGLADLMVERGIPRTALALARTPQGEEHDRG